MSLVGTTRPKFLTAAAFASAVCLLIAASSLVSQAQNHQPYAGQEKRAIKSLSASDIQTLLKGGGWGFAKAAELNGWPGPIHVLELSDKLGLNADQKSKIRAVFDAMRKKAVPLGRKLITLESRLNKAFADRSIKPAALRQMVSEIGTVRAALRHVHLSAHLKTPAILTSHQIREYNRLRGYGSKRSHGGSHHQSPHKHHKHHKHHD